MSDDPDSSKNPDSPQITVAVTILTPAWRQALSEAEPLARRAAAAVLTSAEVGAMGQHMFEPGKAPDRAVEVSLVLADNATLARLNREYRGRDGPTNVLSFAAGEDAGPESSGPAPLGDVVLAYETVNREAEQQNKRLSDHLCHLVVHGVLHLLGHDHETEDQATAMERLEITTLAGIGVANPYEIAESPRECG